MYPVGVSLPPCRSNFLSSKRIFAKSEAAIAGWKVGGADPNLEETIVGSGATVLLGLSGQPGSFTEVHGRAMAQNTSRPVIFPLSNPTASCEATPEDLVKWTDGMGIIATGSPFPPVTLSTGAVVPVGQGNNAFIFPGLGFGAILANATEVTEAMGMAASIALADDAEEKHLAAELVYPPIGELQEVSIKVAATVITDGVATTTKLSPETAEDYVRTHFWRPRYLPFVRG